MNGMADDDYYDVWLDMLGRTPRPGFVALILAKAGVTLDRQLCVYLVHLGLRGPLGVLELADLVEQNHPKVSRTLAKLEARGLVTREDAEHDHRVKTAALTDEGAKVVAKINQGRRVLLDEAFQGWSEADKATLARLTKRFSDAVAAMAEKV